MKSQHPPNQPASQPASRAVRNERIEQFIHFTSHPSRFPVTEDKPSGSPPPPPRRPKYVQTVTNLRGEELLAHSLHLRGAPFYLKELFMRCEE